MSDIDKGRFIIVGSLAIGMAAGIWFGSLAVAVTTFLGCAFVASIFAMRNP